MIQVDPEFKALIPPMSADERTGLESELQADGCRDPLVVWNGILVDGHNRFDICQQHGIEYRFVEKAFDSRADAKIWIIQHGLNRRNIQPYDRGVLALELKRLLAEKAKGNQRIGGRPSSDKGFQISENLSVAPINALRDAAKTADMSHDTLRKIEVIEEKAPEELKQQIRKKEISINAAYKKVTPPAEKHKALRYEPIESDGPIVAEPPPQTGRSSSRPRNGMEFARIAILKLEQILDDDMERQQAFDMVRRWLNEREAKAA